MSGNGSREGRDGNERERDEAPYAAGALAAGVATGVAALLGGLYWYSRGRQQGNTDQQQGNTDKQQGNTARPQPRESTERRKEVPKTSAPTQPQYQANFGTAYCVDLLERMFIQRDSSASPVPSGIVPEGYRTGPLPANPCLSNINALLSDIYVRFVQIQRDDFTLHYNVFNTIFLSLHQKMKEIDPYYRKYSSTVQFAGSHFDNLRIKKPDEFDMDIVIDLPLNLDAHPNPADSDIFIEPKSAGFVQLKMGVQFQKLPMRDGHEWQNNKAAYEWMDTSKYLLRSKFLDWFKGVVSRALNTFSFCGNQPLYFVDGVPYTIRKTESGPAVTLIIENHSTGFQLDVDLVPALKFPESRWPIGPAYRRIPAQCSRGYWMLVGKPIMNSVPHDQARSWRLALHNQERDLMHDSGNLKQAMRLIKKLRDSLGMTKIASYYIKTLFFLEIVERNDKQFWHRSSPADLFRLMVGQLHKALVNGKIPYFWNKSNNLLEGVGEQVLFQYAAKLVPLMQILQTPHEYKQVARYLLTVEEFREYNAKFLHI